MTALLFLFLVVVVLGAVLGWVRRSRSGRRMVKTHHRALDALGQIATGRTDPGEVSEVGDEERSHVRVVGDASLSRPTTPRVPRQLRAGRGPVAPSIPPPRWAARVQDEQAAENVTNGSHPAGLAASDSLDRSSSAVSEVSADEGSFSILPPANGNEPGGDTREASLLGDSGASTRAQSPNHAAPAPAGGEAPATEETAGDEPVSSEEPANGTARDKEALPAADRISLAERRDRSPWRRSARIEPTEEAAGSQLEHPPRPEALAGAAGSAAVFDPPAPGNGPELEQAPVKPVAHPSPRGTAGPGADRRSILNRFFRPLVSQKTIQKRVGRLAKAAAAGAAGTGAAAPERTATGESELTVFPAEAAPPGQPAPPAVDDWVRKALGWTDDGIDDWWLSREGSPTVENDGSDDPDDPTLVNNFRDGTDWEEPEETDTSFETGDDLWNQADDVWTAPSAAPGEEQPSPAGHRGGIRRIIEHRTRSELIAIGSAVLVAIAVVVVLLAVRTPPATRAGASAGARSGAQAATRQGTASAKSSGHAAPPSTTTTTTAPPPVRLVSTSATEDVYELRSPTASIQLTSTQTGRSWVVARHGDDSGTLAFEGLFAGGEQRSFQGPFWFDLGVPDSVVVRVDGTAITPPSSGTQPVDLQFNAPTAP